MRSGGRAGGFEEGRRSAAVHCPSCGRPLNLKDLRPGRFTPACPGCGRPFLLIVPEDEAGPVSIAALEDGGADRPPGPRRSPPASDPPAPSGGYRRVRELGRGTPGTVALARQWTVGRFVVLRVVDWRRPIDPKFVARLVREAYAAAPIDHPHLVRIHGIGGHEYSSFISAEFVEGEALDALPRGRGPLDPEPAAAYVLQAARGLKYARDQGITEADIQPKNLLVDRHGRVRVADLGLVKSPERAEELDRLEASGASPVDAGADIAALGRTLHALATGRPMSEVPTARGLAAARVPAGLSEIILRMAAERPEDRFPSLEDAIRALEANLGVASPGSFTPDPADAEALEHAAAQHRASPAASGKPRILAAFAGLSALMVALNLLGGWPIMAGGFLGLAVLTFLAYGIVDGVMRGNVVSQRARALLLTGRPVDWLTMGAALLLALAVLWVVKLFWVWAAFSAAAALLAIVMHREVDRRIDAERAPALGAAEALLKQLRLRGIEEDTLRHFVFTHAGERWERFFEDLFGYEAKREARARWAREARRGWRSRAGVWREPIVAWIDARLAARRDAHDRAAIREAEERNRTARGENLVTARRKARRIAEAMVATAAELRPRPGEAPSRPIAEAIRQAARHPEQVLVEAEKGQLYRPRDGGWPDLLLGPRTRFLLGAGLLVGFLAWANQNGLVERRHVEQVAQRAREAVQARDLGAIPEAARAVAGDVQGRVAAKPRTEPLRLPGAPAAISRLFDGYGSGVAGLILLGSAFVRGWKPSLFAIPAAILALAGPSLGMPSLGPLSPEPASWAIAAALAAAGLAARKR